MRSSLSWLRGSSRQGRKVHDRVRVISCSRMSAARTASSRSRRTNLSTATILRCTSSCGTSIFRSSIPGLNTIRMFVPLATRSKWRWDGGWLTAHARNSGRTTTGFARRMRTGKEYERLLPEALVDQRGGVAVPAGTKDNITRADEIPPRGRPWPHIPGKLIRVRQPRRQQVLQPDRGNTLPGGSRWKLPIAGEARLDGTEISQRDCSSAGTDLRHLLERFRDWVSQY